VLRQNAGDKITVVAAGVTLFEALKAADALKNEGIGITVVDAYSIKPLGRDVIKAAAQKTNNTIVTVEEHYAEGGLGDAVAGELSADGIRVHKLAVRELPHSGKADELLAKYGINADAIVRTVISLCPGARFLRSAVNFSRAFLFGTRSAPDRFGVVGEHSCHCQPSQGEADYCSA